MRRSTFVMLGILAFCSILATFVVRGSTRLVIGDRLSALLATPFAVLSLVLVVIVFIVAIGELTGVAPMNDDLEE